MPVPENKRSTFRRYLSIALVALFLLVLLKNAWVSDDAYIAFRSVEQIFAGNGAGWNHDERVQVYTSPLWFGLLVATRLATTDLFLAAIFLSAACCIGALVATRSRPFESSYWPLFVLSLLGSKAFMDFSSSGLENPLLYLLTTCFVGSYFRFCMSTENRTRRKHFLAACSMLGVIAITRHDMVTVVAVPFAYMLYLFLRSYGIRAAATPVCIAFLPTLIWTTFSVVYYGTPFPNTAYAKLMNDVPFAEIVEYGAYYLWISFQSDFFGFLIVSLFTVRALWSREAAVVFLWMGLLTNLGYVVLIGGDFMIGRFLSIPILVSALGLLFSVRSGSDSDGQSGIRERLPQLKTIGLVAVVVLMLWLETPLRALPTSGYEYDLANPPRTWRHIVDERDFYFKTNSLWAYLHRDTDRAFPDHAWCRAGTRAAKRHAITEFDAIGMYGYCAGPDLIVIDRLALASPFLSHLPRSQDKKWWPGHFPRDLPAGFLRSRQLLQNHLQDVRLAKLWDDTALLSRAPLFSKDRWRAIWRVNTGF